MKHHVAGIEISVNQRLLFYIFLSLLSFFVCTLLVLVRVYVVLYKTKERIRIIFTNIKITCKKNCLSFIGRHCESSAFANSFLYIIITVRTRTRRIRRRTLKHTLVITTRVRRTRFYENASTTWYARNRFSSAPNE